ncbi:MAG: hypothetical protein RL223_1046 [Pseudomonadota bacterium]|jgi:MSHA biogenesis protein MshQ
MHPIRFLAARWRTAILLVCVFVCGPWAARPAHAAIVSFAGHTMQTNGAATLVSGRLQMTPNTVSTGGSAWKTTPVSTQQSFVSTYGFTLTGWSLQADGVAFAMQPVSASALGGNGIFIGMRGLPSFVGATVHTYTYNTAGLESDTVLTPPSVPVNLGGCGTVTGRYVVSYEVTTSTLRLAGKLSACGNEVTVNDTMTVNLYTKFGASMYIGFTGATGTNAAQQQITSWTYTPVAPTVHYAFDDAYWSHAAGDVPDSSGNGRAATSQYGAAAGGGCSPWGVFAGTTAAPDRVVLPYSTALVAEGSFSVMAWVRARGGSGVIRDMANLRVRGETTPYKGWALRANDTDRYEFWLAVENSTADTQGDFGAVVQNSWVHLAATFDAESGPDGLGAYRGRLTLYRDGVAVYSRLDARHVPNDSQPLVIGSGGFNPGTTGDATGFAIYPWQGDIDEFKLFDQALSVDQVQAQRTRSLACIAPHHLELRHGSGQGLSCAPSTLTVAACSDAACAQPYIGGVSGTLGWNTPVPASGGGSMSVVWPDGAGFTIPAGSSSTTLRTQVTTAGTVRMALATSSPTPTSATTCTFGSPSCTWTASDAGLLFDVPDHVSELSRTFTVSAVKKADNSLACTPAFASVTRPVTFSCAYQNPASGTKAVRVGGAALNAGNNAAAACDAGGRAVNLAFNASGVASTTVQYADVGRVGLSASYTGGANNDSGLVLAGSDAFVAQPWYLVMSLSAGARAAGSPFTGTVRAINAASQTTPNFGREVPAEGVTLEAVRAKPLGTGAVTGSFSGTVGAFSSGQATLSDLRYSEVGMIDVSARLSSGSYLGTGWLTGGGSNLSAVTCSIDGGLCILPSGVVAIVAYGTNTAWIARAQQTGTLACNALAFGGDPAPGQIKTCFYLPTSGVNILSAGTVGPFLPYRFDVTAPGACDSFSYAGQSFTATVTAREAGGGITRNYDGSLATSPNYAKLTTLAEATPLGLGSLSVSNVSANAFAAGVASTSASYSFSNKQTGPQTLQLRATDSQGVSSAGGGDLAMPLRSGRLRVSNAYGPSTSPLAVPLTLEYFSGNSWVVNTADTCTSLSAPSFLMNNPRSALGGLLGGTSTSVTAVSAFTAGKAELTLAPVSPAGSSASFDLAVNLGSLPVDRTCLNSLRGITVGAARPWLRSQWGHCANGWDADPSGHVSFGIHRGDSRKTLQVQDLP